MYKKELKVLDNLFEYNGVTNIMTGRDYSQHLLWMNEYLADIDNLLADADLQTIDHHNFTDEIEYSNNFLIALLDYAKDISSFVLLLLDNPFKDNLMDNAVDKINDVDINSYSTANTLDIKRLDYCDSGTYYTSIGSVTFQDFIVGNAAYVVPDEFKGFTTQFSNYYENVKTNLNGLSEEEFLYGLLNKDTPEMELKKFVSAVLDITIIKPLIETFTGEDLITGQELSDMERGIKFAGAVVGIITLGTSGILKVPLEQAAQQLGRTLLIDAAATSASYATGIICEKLDLPVPLTVVLCIAVGTAVSITLNSIEYRKVSSYEPSLNESIMNDLAQSGVKYNADDVVAVVRNADGKIIWLENGTEKAGLQHIITEHVDDFANVGIPQNEIPDYIMTAVDKGQIVGYQGRGTGRPIYEFVYKGEVKQVAITIGSNGFVVGANPK
ncbi:pre-toxin TG domain-containing protein [Pseudobutyrivibrio sp.]|uniref:pre-toxin TG domain-containing protein n=1 Tax=Pseudobutyrivibrio sp. TaxID=2014367 RepID=UPI00386D3520